MDISAANGYSNCYSARVPMSRLIELSRGVKWSYDNSKEIPQPGRYISFRYLPFLTVYTKEKSV